jgi:hypothetical protein
MSRVRRCPRIGEDRGFAKVARLANPSEDAYPYTSIMTDEDTVLSEAMDNLK